MKYSAVSWARPPSSQPINSFSAACELLYGSEKLYFLLGGGPTVAVTYIVWLVLTLALRGTWASLLCVCMLQQFFDLITCSI